MKSLFLHILVVLPMVIMSCNTGKDEITPQVDDEFSQMIDSFPLEPLSKQEQSSLLFMREEEKLARDVYNNLYSKWSARIFDNISSSEQTHMDAILELLNRYELEDPASVQEIGVFMNPELQKLYNELIVVGKEGIIDALKVGAAIEEIDIIDLQTALNSFVDNQDIEWVYEMLIKGSENHLRSFVKNLANQGVTYQAQYLTEEEFEAIINL